MHISADIALTPRDPAELQAYTEAVTSSSSPLSGRYLKPRQFDATFAPLPSALHAVTAQLRADHLHVAAIRDGGLLVSFSGTARELASAFDTSFDSYRERGGRTVYAETSPATLPRSIARNVEALVGLDDVTRPTPVGTLRGAPGHGAAPAPRAEQQPGGPVACPAATKAALKLGGLTDAAIARAYGLDGLYKVGAGGAGETIAVYEEEPFERSDLLAFDTCYFGRSRAKAIAARVSIRRVDGGQQYGPGFGEAILDMEDVTALAPDARYEVYEAPETNTGYLDNYAQFVQDDTAQLLTSSWGECEPWDEEYLPGFLQVSHVLYEQAAAQGQTILNAIGDTGSDCMEQFGIKDPVLSLTDTADDPWVLGVGGTTITDASDPPSEQVWNDGPNGGAGGGGISSVWGAPAWQLPFINHAIVRRAESVSGTDFCAQVVGRGSEDVACRESPDVSAQADEFTGAITVYVGIYGGWTTIGGTSSSSPIWAGVLADIGSTRACRSPGHELGFVVPKLYAIAGNASEYAHSFNDITEGDNDAYDYSHGLYPATKGFDMASGLGSPQVTGPGGANDGLARNLCNPTGTVPTVTRIDSHVNPGTNAVPASDPGIVRISGSGFESGGTREVKGVTVGGVTAGSFRVDSPRTLVVRLPSAAREAGKGSATEGVGTFNVAVTLKDGETSNPSRAATVVYYSTTTSKSGNPVVDDVTAAGSGPAGGQVFRVYGAGFDAARGRARVIVGGRPASDVHVMNNDLLTAKTPPEQPAACLNKKRDVGPGQSSFSASVDTCQVEVAVVVDGRTSPEDVIKPEYQGPTADEPAAGGSTESYPARTELDYLPTPRITAVTVSSRYASEAGGSTATITGTGLGELGLSWYDVGPYQSYFSANYGFVSVSPTELVVTLPAEAPTSSLLSEPVMVETAGSPNTGNLDGAAPSNAVETTYEPTPSLKALRVFTSAGRDSPYAAGPTSGGTPVELLGSGFGPSPMTQADNGLAAVAFTDVGAAGAPYGWSNTTVTELRSGSETSILFDTTDDNPGIDQVSWCNVSGCTTPLAKNDVFTYYPRGNPWVGAATPSSGPVGARVTITGANLGFVEAVYFGREKASTFANMPALLDCGSTTAITATAPKQPIGSKVHIRVVTLESAATGFGKSPVNKKVAFTYTGG